MMFFCALFRTLELSLLRSNYRVSARDTSFFAKKKYPRKGQPNCVALRLPENKPI